MPKVRIPTVPIPSVPIPGRHKNSTEYSMNTSELEHNREVLAEEEEGFQDERKSEVAHLNQARHERTWEEKEKEESFSLEEDTLSLLYLADYLSISFLVSVAVFALQLVILLLILADLTRDAPLYHEVVFFPLECPIDVERQVVVAQFLSLLVATFKEEDIFYSLKALIIVGHDERVSVRFPGATPVKWWLANSLRFITGLGNIMVSFFFIVGADSVLDIFEGFAAMEFVSYIDNIIFRLAQWGYMGKPLQRMAIKVESVSLENRREKGRWWAALTVAFLGLTLVPLVTFWTQVRIAQKSGFYLDQSIADSVVVQFGNEQLELPPTIFNLESSLRNLTAFNQRSPPDLQYAYFSASYKVLRDQDGKMTRYNHRPIYVERDDSFCNLDEPTCGMFYYCEELETWVFTIPALGSARKELDKCEWGWLAQSEQTEAFGLEEVNDLTWKVYTGVMTQTSVFIKSDTCSLDSDCSLNGVCVDGLCECDDDWQGRYCHVRRPFCPALLFVNYGSSSREYEFIEAFELATNPDGSAITVYQRPVYYRNYTVDTDRCSSSRQYELYMYAGRRWFLTYWCFEDIQRFIVDGQVKMEENLHAFWDNILGLDLKWFSEITTSFTGTGLTMYQIRDSYSTGSKGEFGVAFESEGGFECMDSPCTEDLTACGRKGSCIKYNYTSKLDARKYEWRRCSCRDYYGGEYCQFSPDEIYTREHFREFLANPSASTTVYQSQYWDPWFAAIGGFSASTEASVDVGQVGDIEPAEPSTNTTSAPPATAPTRTVEPTPTETVESPGEGNIFANQSDAGA
jgi:EGF-like domain